MVQSEERKNEHEMTFEVMSPKHLPEEDGTAKFRSELSSEIPNTILVSQFLDNN